MRGRPHGSGRLRVASGGAVAPPPLATCGSAGRGWRSLPTSGYYRPPAARLGSGRRGGVFANDSTNETCAWSREARALTRRGYLVGLFETVAGYGFEAQQGGRSRRLRRAGARRIVLIGASVGARAVPQVAARRPRGLAGVVALSAERRLIPSAPGDLLPIGPARTRRPPPSRRRAPRASAASPACAPTRSACTRATASMLSARVVGSGPVGAVLIHEYPRDFCGWLPYARYLSRHGVRALLFDLRCFGRSRVPARPRPRDHRRRRRDG